MDSKKEQRLQESMERLAMIDAQLKQSEKRKNEISAEVNKNRELLQSQAQIKRNIDDNIDYRKKKAEVEELAQQIENYEQKIIQTGDMSAAEVNLKKAMDEKQALVSEVIEIWQFLTLFVHISNNSLNLFLWLQILYQMYSIAITK